MPLAVADEFVCETKNYYLINADGTLSPKETENDIFVFDVLTEELCPVFLSSCYQYSITYYRPDDTLTKLAAQRNEDFDMGLKDDSLSAFYIHAPNAFMLTDAMYVKSGTCVEKQ